VRGKTAGYDIVAARNRAALGLPPLSVPTLQQASTVLPGGAIAQGANVYSAAPKKRAAAKKRKTTRRKATKAKKRSGGRSKRKLKFGSAAYRKKYLGHR
jgi:hypothetical protein